MKTVQLEHKEIRNKDKIFPVCVICDDISSAENVGMVFRTSEAMGVESLYLCGETITPPNRKLLRTSRSTEKSVNYSYVNNVVELIFDLKNQGFTIVSIELTNNSIELGKVEFRKFTKIALVIGNERNGVSAEVLEQSDLSAEIIMYGKNSSMNVVNALSIVLYEITQQLSLKV